MVEIIELMLMMDELAYQPIYGSTRIYEELELEALPYQEITI